MPWCPKCKNEYRAGFTVCSECKIELVDSLPEEKKDSGMADKNGFIHIIDDETGPSVSPEENYVIKESYVIKEEQKDVAADENMNPESVILARELIREAMQQQQQQQDSLRKYQPYQNSADKAEDNRASAYTLLAVGGLGLIMDILVFTGIVPIYQNAGFTRYLVCGVMGALFLLFIVFGFVSMRSSKIYLIQAKSENTLKSEITKWCEENLTGQGIDQMIRLDESLSDEQKYFVRAEKLTALLNDKFMNLDQAFLEHFVDEYYQRLYENE